MIGELVGSLASASTELEASATTMTKTSDVTMSLSNSAASASRAVTDNIQAVAAATEEITSSVNEIGRQVHESNRIARTAVSQAQKTDESIARLSLAAGRINDVVKLITEVAEQTNLLALNATIEAARAGEAGRGFAVVASEVKALATQTAKATAEIDAQVADMQIGDRGHGCRDQGNRFDHHADFRSLLGDRRGCRATGRGDAGDRAKRAAVGAALDAGGLGSDRGQVAVERDQCGVRPGTDGGAIARGRKRPLEEPGR